MEFLKKIPKVESHEDDEEALSLIDLPITFEETKPEPENPKQILDTNFDFKVRDCFASSEMCAADDVFFQGQMLPYRHSVSSDTCVSQHPGRYLSRSESMDHNMSRGVISSSRSSSINSQYSSSSGSTINRKQKAHNYFHSHPSPSPQIRTRNQTPYGNVNGLSRKSNLWDFFRVGLVKTPGIELQNIKKRMVNENSKNNFGSRNSTSSTGSSQNKGNKKIGDAKITIEKKKKNFFDFSGCKCSVNVINPISCDEREKVIKIGESKRKSSSSRYRTFEWIKELSVECAPGDI